jgi:POT family proton-dependent oligopeptide transporter
MSYRTAPVASESMPAGVPYIVGNEAAERFSFYGMRAILTAFMTKYLVDRDGNADVMPPEDAKFWYHLFTSGVYFAPVLGALAADVFWGKYRTIVGMSAVYCLGHLALALDQTRTGLALGLGLIAFGSGIKACVSAHVGDQFGKTNQHLLERVFGWFYLAINLGAFASSLLTPWLLDYFGPRIGPHVAFGVPGLFMLIAAVVFWSGRHKFVHIPPGGTEYLRQTFTAEGAGALGRLAVLYVFVAVYWGLYDQTGSAWVIQADKMDRNLFGWELLESQIQAVNPLLILIFIPLFSYVIDPAINRLRRFTPLRKIGSGLFLMVPAFLITVHIESMIQAGQRPHIAWQLFAYVVLTASEVWVSVTFLEFSYTQAPPTMKSSVMALYLLSISAGNLFAGLVNHFIQNPDGSSKLPGASYYLFFTWVMLGAAVLFVPAAVLFKEKRYLQEEAPAYPVKGEPV